MPLSSLHDTARTSINVSSWKTGSIWWIYWDDITKLAEFLNVTSQGLNRRLAYWIQNDKEFSSFVYLVKEKPSITLSEFLEIEYKFVENPIQVKKGIYDEIQTKRDLENLKPLSKSTYYRKVDQALLSQYSYEKTYLCRWIECPYNGR